MPYVLYGLDATCYGGDTAPITLPYRQKPRSVGSYESRRQHNNLDARLALATTRPVQTELN